MRLPIAAVLTVMMAACASPPPPQTPRLPTSVAASFGRTWDAVIDQFANSNIPVHTMERASGFISTGPLSTSSESRTNLDAYADCGKDMIKPRPDRVEYNVVVRGDSSSATIRTTAKWVRSGDAATYTMEIQCSSLGGWEAAFEAGVRRQAEGRP